MSLKKTVAINRSTQRHILVLLLAASVGLLFLDWWVQSRAVLFFPAFCLAALGRLVGVHLGRPLVNACHLLVKLAVA